MFKEMLETIIERTEGSLGALIMGTDGIAVEKVLSEAGADAIATAEQKVTEFQKQINAYRDLSSSLALE